MSDIDPKFGKPTLKDYLNGYPHPLTKAEEKEIMERYEKEHGEVPMPLTLAQKKEILERRNAAMGELATRASRGHITAEDFIDPETGEFAVGTVGMEALGDRLIVLEDEFRSGYECTTCSGSGSVACDSCDNGKSRVNKEITCKACSGTTNKTCPACDGKKAVIVIPDASQRPPATGRVVSIGPDVKTVAVSEGVMYGSYAGHLVEIPLGTKTLRLKVLHATELLCRLRGHLAYRRPEMENPS